MLRAVVPAAVGSSGAQNSATTTQGGLTTFVPGVMYSQILPVTTSGTTASPWFSTGSGTLVVPANYLVAGKTLRVTAYGALTTQATPGTISLSFAIGSSVILTTGANTPTASLTTGMFKLEIVVTIETSGASGTCAYSNRLLYPENSFAAGYINTSGSANSIAVNTTIPNTLALSSTNSVAGGSVFQINNLLVETLA
jgi:hypothetical protein